MRRRNPQCSLINRAPPLRACAQGSAQGMGWAGMLRVGRAALVRSPRSGCRRSGPPAVETGTNEANRVWQITDAAAVAVGNMLQLHSKWFTHGIGSMLSAQVHEVERPGGACFASPLDERCKRIVGAKVVVLTLHPGPACSRLSP